MSWIREPAVAGTFYPSDPKQLKDQLDSFLKDSGDAPVRAVMAPHAGYVYSGRFAGEVYRRIRVPDTVLLLCPNHTGLGKRVSVWGQGAWRTPLGEVPVAEREAAELLGLLGETSDRGAHGREHANEVHVPFLQRRNPAVRILPVTLGGLRWEGVERTARALGAFLKDHPEILAVASTDMSHYIPAARAKKLDDKALACVKDGDGAALYRTVVEHDISMCGFIPTSTLLAARPGLRGEVLAYGHSGEVTGDLNSVVAYAGAWFLD